MLVRIKEFEIEGAKVKLGALTVEQVEQLVTKAPENSTVEELLERMRKVICAGLNNAINGGGETQWTPERVPKEMDLLIIPAVWRAIVELSGLEVKPAGEAKAAS